MNHIRPLLDPRNKLNTLLVLDGPRQLTNIHGYIKALGRKYGFEPPSSTKVRKIGFTTVQLQCGDAEANLILRQLSHFIHTQARHYEGIVGAVHAASAFRRMEALRDEGEKLPPTDKPEESASAHIRTAELPKDEEVQKRKRVRFIEDEEHGIREHFASEIAAKKTPTLLSCAEFLRDQI